MTIVLLHTVVIIVKLAYIVGDVASFSIIRVIHGYWVKFSEFLTREDVHFSFPTSIPSPNHPHFTVSFHATVRN